MTIDKKLVALRFNRATEGYDQATPLQASMGQSLLNLSVSMLQENTIHSILELGCGTGRLTLDLLARFPGAQIVAVDLASEMISQAKKRMPKNVPVTFELTDAEGHSEAIKAKRPYDLIIANAAVQWFAEPIRTIRRYTSLLSENGLLSFSSFGPQTFHELVSAFQQAEKNLVLRPQSHTLSFLSKEQWKAALGSALVIHEALRIESFDSVHQFLNTLAKMGAAMPRKRSLSKRLIQSMFAIYEEQFRHPNTEQIPVSFHLLYAVYRKTTYSTANG